MPLLIGPSINALLNRQGHLLQLSAIIALKNLIVFTYNTYHLNIKFLVYAPFHPVKYRSIPVKVWHKTPPVVKIHTEQDAEGEQFYELQ